MNWKLISGSCHPDIWIRRIIIDEASLSYKEHDFLKKKYKEHDYMRFKNYYIASPSFVKTNKHWETK
jgi:hypothetical protein